MQWVKPNSYGLDIEKYDGVLNRLDADGAVVQTWTYDNIAGWRSSYTLHPAIKGEA